MITSLLLQIILNISLVYLVTTVLTEHEISEKIKFFFFSARASQWAIASFIYEALECFFCTSFWVSIAVYMVFPIEDFIGNDFKFIALYIVGASIMQAIMPRRD